MSHTKGTWVLDDATGEVLADSVRVCKVYGATVHNVEDNASECMGNARLIENAPRMLHALRKAQSALSLNVYCCFLAEDIGELISCIDNGEAVK